MKEQLRYLIGQRASSVEATLVIREYLQARILEVLQRSGAFQDWAFLGGTALRFLYRLPRFSEDLDFSRTVACGPTTSVQMEFRKYTESIQRVLEAETYTIELRLRPENTVQSAFIAFPGLLYELGLSPHREQKLSIKVEVDTNPPAHAVFDRTLVRTHVFLNLQHYDKASLLAGKLHALLSRSHTKGRDVYDLMWYLSDPGWPEPNLDLLEAALVQSGNAVQGTLGGSWRQMIAERLEAMDWRQVLADVRPFLENSHELDLLTRGNLLGLLGSR
jgi:predicted nucleotidyltransferase component of viral defense system